ncbi:tail Collar domain-containing protein [Geotalea uraniireducens]|uniref:Tail Collar domain-containing protein n=1 Tax=Geotalea uraniireducens TaxID=351604 RepID=A0ABM8EQ24_9BACT|nr:tail fiber protein [Geotalea uraniireducens]BDV44552.1 tail Collar domain-containing protein [Geotalea uraniireducens]
MSDPFYGEIRAFAFTYAPYGWATCDGQLMQVQQNPALFSILGTTYGGDGRATFGLPNLMGRAPMGCGAGKGLTPRDWGDVVGESSVTLMENDFPPHSHTLNAVAANADQTAVASHYLAAGGNPGKKFAAVNTYQSPAAPDVRLAADAVQLAGSAPGPIPHNNMQPYLPVLLCIALTGVWPQHP